MNLLDDGSFQPAVGIDAIVPDEFGVYAIRLRSGAALPTPFQSRLDDLATRVLYVGQAEKQTLLNRLLGNELRARGNGTFIRSIGAVLPRGGPHARCRSSTHSSRSWNASQRIASQTNVCCAAPAAAS
ncbi:GIY-YIG nuclease family protein [Microbacterium sp. NPDC058345]|uniref:GIY-YIG nuclease family protein n=1 Tax=Microbacterium sp. NPDC058345 TaxID=3346455 RepID=UPI00366473EB